LPAVCRALKVWKNSSWVLSRPDELNIVHHEDIHVAETVAELGVAVLLDGGDQLVGEVFAGDVEQPLFRVLLLHIVADGVHQVGLAQAHAAMDEQGVVGIGGGLGHGQGGGMSKAVVAAYHKGIEGILGVQLHRAGGQAIGSSRLIAGGVVLQFGAGQHGYGHAVASHLRQAVGDQGHISVVDHDLHGVDADAQRQHIVFQLHGGEVGLDPGLVGDWVDLALEQLTGAVPKVLHIHAYLPSACVYPADAQWEPGKKPTTAVIVCCG